MKQKRNRKEAHRWSGDVWQLNDKHGPRSGPNSSNEAKQQGGDRTPDRKKEKHKNKKQEQATSEICRKVAEIPPPKR